MLRHGPLDFFLCECGLNQKKTKLYGLIIFALEKLNIIHKEVYFAELLPVKNLFTEDQVHVTQHTNITHVLYGKN